MAIYGAKRDYEQLHKDLSREYKKLLDRTISLHHKLLEKEAEVTYFKDRLYSEKLRIDQERKNLARQRSDLEIRKRLMEMRRWMKTCLMMMYYC